MSDYYLDPRLAEAYDREGADNPIKRDDIPFYVELAKEAAAASLPVLELACGTGRVTIAIAEASVNVVGLDNSPAMLAIARRKSGGLTNVRWIQGDMGDFRLDERFGLVVIPFRSFLVLLTVAEQKACLGRIHDHLVDGGRLALNIFNPNLVLMGRRLSEKRRALRRAADARDQAGGRIVRRWQRSDYGTAAQTVDWRWRREELSDTGALISRAAKTLRLRYVFRFEMEHLLALSGFEVEALYGWFDRRPFADDSAEMVWVARRPGLLPARIGDFNTATRNNKIFSAVTSVDSPAPHR